MSKTLPPPVNAYDSDAQLARLEAAKAYITAAIGFLVEAQEHEIMCGGARSIDELAELKELAAQVQGHVESAMGDVITLVPDSESMRQSGVEFRELDAPFHAA
jgi:1,6-anhydro-N-acetylmuramate kinase